MFLISSPSHFRSGLSQGLVGLSINYGGSYYRLHDFLRGDGFLFTYNSVAI